jgi:hypothetical protein
VETSLRKSMKKGLLTGGGGGSRTPVRKALRLGDYMRSGFAHDFAPRPLESARTGSKLACFPHPIGGGVSPEASRHSAPRLYLAFVLTILRVDGWWFWRVGRSALRPGRVPRACEVDRPPALFSQAEENQRPLEPVFASSTGEGSGSGSRNPSLTPGGGYGQA